MGRPAAAGDIRSFFNANRQVPSPESDENGGVSKEERVVKKAKIKEATDVDRTTGSFDRMEHMIHASWKEKLQDEFDKVYFQRLKQFLAAQEKK